MGVADLVLRTCAMPAPLVRPKGNVITRPGRPLLLQPGQQVPQLLLGEMAGGVTKLGPGAVIALRPEAVDGEVEPGRAREGGWGGGMRGASMVYSTLLSGWV